MWSYHAPTFTTEIFMSHANATLTPAGRLRLAKLVVDEQWSYAHAAERFSVSIRLHAAGRCGTGNMARQG